MLHHSAGSGVYIASFRLDERTMAAENGLLASGIPMARLIKRFVGVSPCSKLSILILTSEI